MVRRFYKLSRDIQFYKLTRPTRERISARGFSWERSSLMFNPFSAIKIRPSTGSGKQGDVFYMFLDDMFKLVKIPGSFSDLIPLFREAVKKPMEYRELLEAFKKGSRDYGDPVAEREQVIAWNRILFHFVHEGWINDVYCDPLFIEGNFETMKEELESEIGDAVNPGRWNREGLPFVFDAAPFACVAQMQMG